LIALLLAGNFFFALLVHSYRQPRHFSFPAKVHAAFYAIEHPFFRGSPAILIIPPRNPTALVENQPLYR
jgi:hypothetical protein